MSEQLTTMGLRRIALIGLLGGLLLAGFVVMQPFLAIIAWAAILSYVSWPLHLRVLRWLGGRRTQAALVMTLFLTLVLALSLFWLGLMLRSEGMAAIREADTLLKQGLRLPAAILAIPWFGPWLQEQLLALGGDRSAWGEPLVELTKQWGGRAMRMVGDLGLNALRLGGSLLTSFFLFRNGERLLQQLSAILHSLLGQRAQDYLDAVGNTTRAVVYGLLLAALAQGLLAGLGYWAVGVQAPVFWGAATALLALIPFGASAIWASIGVWLLLKGQMSAGVGLLLWGALAVSWVDNLVRPLVISGVANVPFLLVLFGVLGGLMAFGLIGLFVGPVILAVLLALWREWAEDRAGSALPPPT